MLWESWISRPLISLCCLCTDMCKIVLIVIVSDVGDCHRQPLLCQSRIQVCTYQKPGFGSKGEAITLKFTAGVMEMGPTHLTASGRSGNCLAGAFRHLLVQSEKCAWLCRKCWDAVITHAAPSFSLSVCHLAYENLKCAECGTNDLWRLGSRRTVFVHAAMIVLH